jgi:hypothetical protein
MASHEISFVFQARESSIGGAPLHRKSAFFRPTRGDWNLRRNGLVWSNWVADRLIRFAITFFFGATQIQAGLNLAFTG